MIRAAFSRRRPSRRRRGGSRRRKDRVLESASCSPRSRGTGRNAKSWCRHRALEDVSAGEIEGRFEVDRRCEHLPVDRRSETRRISFDDGEAPIGVLAPSARRSTSHRRSVRYGAYCTNIEATYFPGGASVSSTDDGIVSSTTGSREGFPYFASSYARSMKS